MKTAVRLPGQHLPEMLGDRWSLVIILDLMVRGFRRFKDFQRSSERIASNTLADRLRKLEEACIITSEAEETDARRVNYRLTESLSLIPPAEVAELADALA